MSSVRWLIRGREQADIYNCIIIVHGTQYVEPPKLPFPTLTREDRRGSDSTVDGRRVFVNKFERRLKAMTVSVRISPRGYTYSNRVQAPFCSFLTNTPSLHMPREGRYSLGHDVEVGLCLCPVSNCPSTRSAQVPQPCPALLEHRGVLRFVISEWRSSPVVVVTYSR